MSNSGDPIHNPSDAPLRRVLLVGWEGADWSIIQPLVDAGEMPHLTALIDRGVMGNIASLVPMVCPLLWTSVATGVFANRHDILTLIEPDGRGGVRPVRSTSRRRKALWNILSQNKLRSVVIGWPATYPAEPIEGVVVSDRFLHALPPADGTPLTEKHTVHPPELFDSLRQLRVHSGQLAHQQLASFVPRMNEINHEADPRVASIATLLAQAASVQQMSTWAAQRENWDFMAVYYKMLGGLNRGFMRYHPPCDGSLDKHDAALYGDVIKTGYKFHDMMLGRLVKLVGPETLVMIVSDHGFHRHPGSPAGEHARDRVGADTAAHRDHRRDAFFCMAGPGIRNDELVFGTRLVDVAPTILASLGLPVPDDMDGRVATRIFRTPPTSRTIQSYEPWAKCDGVWNSELTEDTWVSNSIIENLSAMGLVNLKSEAAAVLEACVLERQLNVAQTYAVQGRFADAVEAYRTALDGEDAISVRLPYIECLFFLGRLDQAAKEVAAIAAAAPDAMVTFLLQARLSIERRDFAEAENYLDRVRYTERANIGVLLQLGWTALSLRRFEQSSMLFEQILDRDPACAQAHDGLGVALLRLGRVEESVFHHTESVRLLYHRSAAHEHLGESLVAAGQLDWADRAFKISLELDPNNKRTHKWLRRVENLRRDSQGGDVA